MKNGRIQEQLEVQEKQIAGTKIQPVNQLNVGTAILPDILTLQQLDNNQPNINVSNLGLSSVFSLLTPDVDKEEQTLMKRKKKKVKQGFKR